MNDISNLRNKILTLLKSKYSDDSYEKYTYLTLLVDTMLMLYQDVMYNIDFQYNESFVGTAVSAENIMRNLNDRGFSLRYIKPAIADVDLFFEVPANEKGGINYYLFPVVKAGTRIGSDVKFELLTDIDTTKYIDKVIEVGETENGVIKKYKVTLKNVKFVAGETVTKKHIINSSDKYLKINLFDSSIIDVVEVIDEAGNVYHKVANLAQDVIFNFVPFKSQYEDITYMMETKTVPYRFVVKHLNEDNVEIMFGDTHNESNFYDLVVNPFLCFSNLKFNFNSDNTEQIFNFDKLTSVSSMGIKPVNGTIYIKYRRGGGPESNVDAGELKDIDNINCYFNPAVDEDTRDIIMNSFSCYNNLPAYGGSSIKDDIEKLRNIATSAIFSQDRCISREDFAYKLYNMPDKIGNVGTFKINIKNNIVDIYVLSNTARGFVKSSQILKDNIKNYISMYTPTSYVINIKDLNIINLSLTVKVAFNFDVDSTTITNIIDGLYKYFNSQEKSNPIVISKIYDILHNFREINSVSDIKLQISKFEGDIGGFNTNLTAANKFYKNGKLYLPENSIWQIDKDNIFIEI